MSQEKQPQDIELDLPDDSELSHSKKQKPTSDSSATPKKGDEDLSAEVQFYAPTHRAKKSHDATPDIGGELSKEEQLISRVLIGSVIAIVIIAVTVFFFMSSEEKVTSTSNNTPSPRVVKPKTPRDMSQDRIVTLSRYAKVWMIQFGSGFDPQQVSLKRLKEDMELTSEQLLDGWNTPIIYEPKADSFTMRSAGSDKQPNTDDDIISRVKMQ